MHNRFATTRSFIDCLRRQTATDYHLVLVDDGSSDGTAAMVTRDVPGCTILRGDGTWWWAGGLQAGIDWLATRNPDPATVVLFINDDVLFDETFLANAASFMKGTARTLLLARHKVPGSSEPVESGVHADLSRLTFRVAARPDEINCLSTRGIFLRWEDIRQIGGFHPRLLPHTSPIMSSPSAPAGRASDV